MKGNENVCNGSCLECKKCRTIEEIRVQVAKNSAAGIVPERLLKPTNIIIHRGYGV